MKLSELLKKVGNFGTSTKLVVKENGKVIYENDAIQSTLEYHANDYHEMNGLNFNFAKVESILIGNNELIVNISDASAGLRS